MFPITKTTLAGIPVEQSADAPKDKIVLHPEQFDVITMACFRVGTVVEMISECKSGGD